MSDNTQSADADNDADAESEDEFTYYPQVKQSPTTIIEGNVTDMVTGAQLDSDVEQNDSAFGIIIEDPKVVGDGTLWKNSNIPEGFDTTSEYNDTVRMALGDADYVRGQEVTDEDIEAAKERLDGLDIDYEDDDASYDDLKVSGTDYKIADPSDQDTSVDTVEVPSTGEEVTTGISLGSRSYESEQVDEFDSDTIMVWYGGMSGQFVGRGLDFNGMPFARYTEDGYLVKGLLDVPIGWRGDRDVDDFDDVPTTNRSKLATDLGRAPRVARPPVLRDDLGGRIFIAIGRYNGGNMYEVHIGRAEDSYDGILEQMRANEQPDYDEFEMKYDQDAEETLAAEFDDASGIYALYHGEGWQDEPDNKQSVLGDEGADTDGGSFDVDDPNDGGVDHPTDEETTFAKTVAEKLAGATNEEGEQATPDEAFKSQGGLEGVIDKNGDNFSEEVDISAVRAEVYKYTDGLSESDA